MKTTDPIRSKTHTREMADYYLKRGKLRNYLLIVLGLHTGLSIGDLLSLRQRDVYDFEAGGFHSHLTLTERKTGKAKCIALHPKALGALALLLGARPTSADGFLFESRKSRDRAIGRVQAWRIIKEAAIVIGAVGHISCHSLRKTFGYFAWKAGVLPVMLMDIFNHSSFEITRRYLGISQDERDAVYLSLELL